MNPLLELEPVEAIESILMCWPNWYYEVEAIAISGCGTDPWVICLDSTSILFTFFLTTPSTASIHFCSSCCSTRPNSKTLEFNHYIMCSPISFSVASCNLLFFFFLESRECCSFEYSLFSLWTVSVTAPSTPWLADGPYPLRACTNGSTSFLALDSWKHQGP